MYDLAVVDSQYVGEDADTPQVGGRRDCLLGRHLWRRELRGPVLDVQRAGRAVAPRVAEVDHLQLVCRRAQQEQILRLQQTSQVGSVSEADNKVNRSNDDTSMTLGRNIYYM